jgi:hypothetical protein
VSLLLEERPAPSGVDGSPATHEVVVRVDQARPRRRFGFAGPVLGLVLAAVLVVGGFALARGWFGLGGLLAPRTIDRSAPVMVERLRNLDEFHGATGTFSATVDVEHKLGIVPTFLAGSRAVYSGVGAVDATVDLGALARTPSRNATGALVIRLPHARIGAVRLDARRSHVMNRDRGMLDRLGGIFVDSPTSEREVQRISQGRIARAAAGSNLRARAERNTARMIEGLATSLGAGRVDVRFGAA